MYVKFEYIIIIEVTEPQQKTKSEYIVFIVEYDRLKIESTYVWECNMSYVCVFAVKNRKETIAMPLIDRFDCAIDDVI